MGNEGTTTAQDEQRITVSYSLPMSVVRAIEYHAYLFRLNKSEAVAQLIRKAQVTAPADEPEKVAS